MAKNKDAKQDKIKSHGKTTTVFRGAPSTDQIVKLIGAKNISPKKK